MLSLLNDKCNISNFTVIIWYTVVTLKGLQESTFQKMTCTFDIHHDAKKINVFAYSHSPESFTSLFIYISWEKKVYESFTKSHWRKQKLGTYKQGNCIYNT